MSKRTIILLSTITVLMLLSMYSFGMGTTYYIFSFTFLLLGILFTIRKDFFDTYSEFMFPKLANLMKEKGESFNRKNRLTNTISYYILSVIFFFNGSINYDMENRDGFNLSLNDIIVMGIIIIPVVALILLVSYYITKKSKTFLSYTLLSILLGVSICIVTFVIIGVYFYFAIMQ